MIWIKTEDGQCKAIEGEIWVSRQRNGTLVRIPGKYRAEGVSDGEMTWSLGKLPGYPLARLITRAEYEEDRQKKGGSKA